MRRLRLLVVKNLRPLVTDAKEKMMSKATSFVEYDALICIELEDWKNMIYLKISN